jgi:hypothetical protein
MLTRILEPLPVLAGALLAIPLALLYIDHGIGLPLIIVLGAAAVIFVIWGIGRRAFKKWPYAAGIVMEIGLLLPILAGAVVGSVLVWLAIDVAPPDTASDRAKAVYAAFSTALAAYFASAIMDPDEPLWNPVKSAIKSVGDKFKARTTDTEKDADDAIKRDRFGPLAHTGDPVDGWGWGARRKRTTFIKDAL